MKNKSKNKEGQGQAFRLGIVEKQSNHPKKSMGTSQATSGSTSSPERKNLKGRTDLSWRELLEEDPDYRSTVQEVDEMLKERKVTTNSVKKILGEEEKAKQNALLKEHKKWSKDVYTPKTLKIYEKSDENSGNGGNSVRAKEFDRYLDYNGKVAKEGGYPTGRVYRDRWDAAQYDPWAVARRDLKEASTVVPLPRDPMKIQEDQLTDEARSLYLLDTHPQPQPEWQGIPSLRAMKATRYMCYPYSYHAWNPCGGSGRGGRHWVEEGRLPDVPSVCASIASGGDEEETKTRKNQTKDQMPAIHEVKDETKSPGCETPKYSQRSGHTKGFTGQMTTLQRIRAKEHQGTRGPGNSNAGSADSADSAQVSRSLGISSVSRSTKQSKIPKARGHTPSCNPENCRRPTSTHRQTEKVSFLTRI